MMFDASLIELDNPPARGEFNPQAYKDRVAAALGKHAQRAEALPPKVYEEKEDKPKAKKADHNKRTEDFYRAQGYERVLRVDWFDTRTMRSHDFLGFADMIALKEGQPPMLIQLTSKANLSTRVKKCRENVMAAAWLSTGSLIECIGWEIQSNGRYAQTVVRL
jgi:hypothetical protein